MGTLPATPSLPFIIFTSVMILLGFAAMTIYILQYMTTRAAPFWSGTRVPALPLPWHYIIIIFLCLAINGAFIPWMLPIAGIFLAMLAMISLGKIPNHFWRLHSKEILKYFKISLGIFLVIIIPLQLTAVLSDVALAYFGIPIEPQDAIEKLLQSKNAKDISLFFLDAILIAPLWEEIVFRGFLYPIFKAKIGKKIALVLISLFFALAHNHLPTFIPLAFFGMILGWLYEKQGSLGYPIALHAIFNTFSAASVLLLKT